MEAPEKHPKTIPDFRHVIELICAQAFAISFGETGWGIEQHAVQSKIIREGHARCCRLLVGEDTTFQPVDLTNNVLFAVLAAAEDSTEGPNAPEGVVDVGGADFISARESRDSFSTEE